MGCVKEIGLLLLLTHPQLILRITPLSLLLQAMPQKLEQCSIFEWDHLILY